MYIAKSEFVLLKGVLAACDPLVGLELFHVDSDTTDILSDIAVCGSKLGSSTRFNNLFAS